ncbi:MAG TPA: amidohydrolase family protein [Dyella sp.]|uniref:amidohydrolase family protein n=1 Tax=Dyella sp. TaxID=1869338 RepID=UPI002D783C64|nr:amidohydrolase family protein [Dyella sp.]HET6555595.1 amidohydrolase family protein [Dyella sp.]
MTRQRSVWAVALAGILSTSALAADMSTNGKEFVAYGQPVIAFTHATVVDGTGNKAARDQTLVIDAGRIVALGRASRVKVPGEATVIDAKGKTLLPGFVMVHEHMFYPAGGAEYNEMSYSFPRLYLAGGTTTMRTAGSMMPYADINVRDAIARGDVLGPDIDATGPYLNGPGLPIPGVHALSGVDDAERTVDYWADEGATSFKAYMNITRAELQRVIDVAHRHHAKVTGHLCSVTYREAVHLGIDNLEHGFFVATDFRDDKQPDDCPRGNATKTFQSLDPASPEVTSLIKLMVDHHVALTSTLTVFETFVAGRPKAPQGALELMLPEVRKAYEASWDKAQHAAGPFTPEAYAKISRLEKQFSDAGGLLLAGTDPTGYGGVVPGYSSKREIELLVEEGFSFEQAVKVATANGAKYLGRDKDVGTLAVGKRADIVVIDGDPVHDASAIERMPLVFKQGVGYDTQKIFAATQGTVGLH